MKRPDHEAYHSLRFLEDEQHRESGAFEKGAPLLRTRSDEFLLCHAVWTEDGNLLTPALASLLMNGSRFGPSTFLLIDAAQEQNPPRGVLVSEISRIWGASTVNLIFWRVCREMGLFKILLDRMAGNEEERAYAEREIEKVEATLNFWEAGFECEAVATQAGMETYTRFGLKPNLDEVSDD